MRTDEGNETDRSDLEEELAPDAIAIIGMAGRFPGAGNIKTFWHNQRNGIESIRHFKDSELEDNFTDEQRNSPDFVKARPILDDVDLFDADFFGMYPREAALTDPQQRIFLECAWEALEDGGYDPAAYEGAIGVFAGCTMNTYFQRHVCGDRAAVEDFTSNFQVGNYAELVGAVQDFVATRVSYKLDLRGPSIMLGTACSTSLLAVSQACQSLLLYQSDMALAGGVSITFPQQRGYVWQDGGMVSKDGSCRPFDAEASGTIFGSGSGIVLLKRLDEAVDDGDHIYAVIRGFGVNNDGASKVGFTAPSIDQQAAVIADAHAMAEIDAETIGYVECHGTATPLGDPIEFAGLIKAFAGPTDNHCTLGSVKANVGHLDAASGVTGLIKAALCLHESEIPPQLNFNSPNPHIDLENSPFTINKQLMPWPMSSEPRRAGVSSFGVGGTNVHVVLEEAPQRTAEIKKFTRQQPWHILPLSARSKPALERMQAALAEHLENDRQTPLADIAYTLQTGRRGFEHRSSVVCRNIDEAIEGLRQAEDRKSVLTDAAPIVFMFPGQGAQYPGMGQELYKQEPVFREILDKGSALLKPILGQDLVELLYSDIPLDDDTPHPIGSTVLAQPALFLINYAMARLLMSTGIKPSVMIGHSVGEFVAACLADVFSFEDGLRLVAARARLMQEQPAGAMLSVRLSQSKLEPLLQGTGLEIAAINGPSLCVVSGEFETMDRFEDKLNKQDIANRRLHTSHAFHSAMMDNAVAGIKQAAAGISFKPPSIDYISCVSGKLVLAEEAMSPDYWAAHCRQPVRFADGIATLAKNQDSLFLEVGPGRTLATLVGQNLPRQSPKHIVTSMPDFANRQHGDSRHFAETIGNLWTYGLKPDWSKVESEGCHRVSLPTYQFDRKRHWIDAPAPVSDELPSVADNNSPESNNIPIPPLSAACSAPITATISTAEPKTLTDDSPMSSPKDILRDKIVVILEDLSGEELADVDPGMTFLELGFDSLFLGQFAQKLQKNFGIKITFRQLLRDFSSTEKLAEHLAETLPPEALPIAAPQPVEETPSAIATSNPQPVASAPMVAEVSAAVPMNQPVAAAGLQGIFQSQLQTMQQLMSQQLAVLQGTDLRLPLENSVQSNNQPISEPAPVAAATPVVEAAPSPAPTSVDEAAPSSRFRVYSSKKSDTSSGLTQVQQNFIDDLVTRYNERTPGSKSSTQANRDVLADPRAANGFRAEWKEIVYPVVCPRAKGSRIWDVDGNEYIDLVNGYGQTAFGHSPDFVVKAVAAQMEDGFPIGPQSPLAGEVAQMISDMTGNERITFCNTGSEAVMAALRLSRTVTGREKLVVFAGAYHGQFDEVLIKGVKAGLPPKALPIAPGIPSKSVGNMIVLPYGTPESLEWIRDNAEDLAAVLVEPVQSRYPNFRPKEFLKEIRSITEASETALVFDEVVTGFRVHPGGMQELFGIRADLATYGKVIGGGMPVGILGGKKHFMDALDGGKWQYGDDSEPEVAPTFFAGTFVRHPLVLAAVRSVLLHLKEKGPELQTQLSARTGELVEKLNADLARRGLSTRVETFSSWFFVNFADEDHLGSLFYAYMRLLGIHISEGFPCFLTTEHSEADCARIEQAFAQSLDALQSAGILVGEGQVAARPAINGVAQEPKKTEHDDNESLPNEVPLTQPQMEIILSAQLGDEASCSYNESVSLRLEGDLNRQALAASLNDIVTRHEALRAYFGKTGQGMRVRPGMLLVLPHKDFREMDNPEDSLAELMAQDARTSFNLADGPLVRAKLVQLADNTHVLMFTAHHIICDGWSMNTLMEELAALYTAHLDGRRADLPTPLSFRRYALDQAQKNETGTDEERFWTDQFRELPDTLELPTDRSRSALRSFRGATYSDSIDELLYRKVRDAGVRAGSTMFGTMFFALQTLMGRLSGQSDVVMVVPTAGQSLLDDQNLVGHCVNFLPIRVPIDHQTLATSHLDKVNDQLMEVFEHRDYTFGTLIQKLGVKRDPNHPLMLDVQFNLEKLSSKLNFLGLESSLAPNPKAACIFDLFFNMIESEDGIRIDVDYNTDLYDEATIARWIGHLRVLLKAFASNAEIAINSLPLLGPKEKNWLIEDLNDTTRDYPHDRLIHQLIEDQVEKTPQALALSCEDDHLTYDDLNKCANRLARHLQENIGVETGRVAIATDRSFDMVISLLAVMKAGYAYVPLDPEHPSARLQQTLDMADVCALICSNKQIAALASGNFPVIDLRKDKPQIREQSGRALELPKGKAANECAAYVIFTSGSTGKPKGVEIPHQAVVNFLTSMADKPGFDANDLIVAVTTISFDIAGLEILLPLITGGRAVIASRSEVKDGFALVEIIKNVGATVVQATPTLWRILLEAGLDTGKGLKMLCGGEPMPRDLADDLIKQGGELWNMYGPTETTIWSSTGLITSDTGPITIGEPLANTQLHILGPNDNLVPIGVSGDLYIGGDGLALGYFNRPDLTSDAFREISLDGGAAQRLYNTGDVGRRLSSGAIQLLGRKDQQIKLRGFRIELEEIENVLHRAMGIGSCAIALRNRPPIGDMIVGYYMPLEGAVIDEAELATHMAAHLPNYMVPSHWMRLETLPKTPNGKLNRKALPDPGFTANKVRSSLKLPGTGLEKQLATIWRDVLGLKEVGINENLFSLGADSLLMFKIAARMMDQGLGLEAKHLLAYPTIGELAKASEKISANSDIDQPRSSAPSLSSFARNNRSNEGDNNVSTRSR
jgi:amino acid adenylation domain-containing protein